MKYSFISLEKLPYNGSQWHVQINSSNGNFCGVQDFYTYPENLKLFGMDLCKFPQDIQDGVKFELGDRQENWSYYLLNSYFFIRFC